MILFDALFSLPKAALLLSNFTLLTLYLNLEATFPKFKMALELLKFNINSPKFGLKLSITNSPNLSVTLMISCLKDDTFFAVLQNE